jgi:hypothetical protein
MYINLKGGRQGAHLFLFFNWQSKVVLLLGSAQCSKKNGDSPLKKKQKKV